MPSQVNLDQFCLTRTELDDPDACEEIKYLKNYSMFTHSGPSSHFYGRDYPNIFETFILSEVTQFTHIPVVITTDNRRLNRNVRTIQQNPRNLTGNYWICKFPVGETSYYVRLEKWLWEDGIGSLSLLCKPTNNYININEQMKYFLLGMLVEYPDTESYVIK